MHVVEARADGVDAPPDAGRYEDPPTEGSAGPFGRRLAIVALLAAAWRLTWLYLSRARDVGPDGFAYSAVADSVARGDGFANPLLPDAPTALHPPGWSALLALASSVGLDSGRWHQVVAALVGTATVALLGLLGRRLAGDRAGLIAATVAAVHPELWGWERELASETLLLPLAVVAILASYEIRANPGWVPAAVLGAVIGLLVLTRSEQALLLPFLAAPVILLGRGDPWRRRFAELALTGAVAALVLTPWLAYNHDRFQEPVYLSTGAGVTLRYANNPATYDGPLLGYGDPTTWTRLPPEFGDESVTDGAYREDALDFIGDELGRLPAVIAAREGRTWGVFRSDQQASLDQAWGGSPRWIHVAGLWTYRLTVPLAVVGAVALRRRRTSLVPLLAPIGVVVVYVAATYGQTRYRVTADLVLVALAAVGIDALARRWRSRPVIDLTEPAEERRPPTGPRPTPRPRPATTHP